MELHDNIIQSIHQYNNTELSNLSENKQLLKSIDAYENLNEDFTNDNLNDMTNSISIAINAINDVEDESLNEETSKDNTPKDNTKSTSEVKLDNTINEKIPLLTDNEQKIKKEISDTNNNTLSVGGGNISWNGKKQMLSWSSPIHITNKMSNKISNINFPNINNKIRYLIGKEKKKIVVQEKGIHIPNNSALYYNYDNESIQKAQEIKTFKSSQYPEMVNILVGKRNVLQAKPWAIYDARYYNNGIWHECRGYKDKDIIISKDTKYNKEKIPFLTNKNRIIKGWNNVPKSHTIFTVHRNVKSTDIDDKTSITIPKVPTFNIRVLLARKMPDVIEGFNNDGQISSQKLHNTIAELKSDIIDNNDNITTLEKYFNKISEKMVSIREKYQNAEENEKKILGKKIIKYNEKKKLTRQSIQNLMDKNDEIKETIGLIKETLSNIDNDDSDDDDSDEENVNIIETEISDNISDDSDNENEDSEDSASSDADSDSDKEEEIDSEDEIEEYSDESNKEEFTMEVNNNWTISGHRNGIFKDRKSKNIIRMKNNEFIIDDRPKFISQIFIWDGHLSDDEMEIVSKSLKKYCSLGIGIYDSIKISPLPKPQLNDNFTIATFDVEKHLLNNTIMLALNLNGRVKFLPENIIFNATENNTYDTINRSWQSVVLKPTIIKSKSGKLWSVTLNDKGIIVVNPI